MRTQLYTPKAQGFPGVNWLVFNMNNTEGKKARSAFIGKFGEAQWRLVMLPIIRKGIMSIFHNGPTPETAFYVNFVAQLVDERFKDKWIKCICGDWAAAGIDKCMSCHEKEMAEAQSAK